MRVNRDEARDCGTKLTGCLGLTQESAEKIAPGALAIDEIQQLKIAWFWAGWQFDVTLLETTQTNSTINGEYFIEHLYEHGYYNHATYMRIRKSLAVAYEHGAAPGGYLRDDAHAWKYFMDYGRGLDENKMPPAGEARELYKRINGNLIRMVFLLVLDERASAPKGFTAGPLLKILPTDQLAEFLKRWGTAKDAELVSKVAAAL